jgi:CheY-like chemotaxis protein
MTENSESKVQILVVDDDSTLCSLFKTYLEDKGHFVEVANRGEEALVKIGELEPHVIILDINMPGITGDKLVSVITSMYPKIKVIMVSGNIEDSQKDLIIFGAFHCFRKPVDLEDLNNKILEAVS